MDSARWLRFGILLVVVFVASVAAGAFIGRSRAPTLVAAVPSPTPAATQAVTASPTNPPTNPPTLTLAPTQSPTVPPTVPPPPTTAPTVLLDPATAEDFAARLLEAIQAGDTQYLFDRLHPAVIARYDTSQCRAKVDGFTADPTATWTVVNTSGPAAWSWESDSLTTTIDGAWTVTIKEPGRPKRDLHFAPTDGLWRWFLDCGTPHA